MKLKPIMLTMACAFLSVGAASAADKPEAKPPANAVAADKPAPGFGFGSGTGAGPGGAPGSASSLADGFGSLTSNGGTGTQVFGGGFGSQPPANPLSSPGGSAMGPN